MTKVITYGTYDLLHHGHIKLLERAKALGDYLIVGVTSDDYDRTRGKINVNQSLMERIESVRRTGLADEIIVEEYEGQKIDDIKRLGVDIFTVGSDWVGKFDYLSEFCRVVYLDRTQGVSSSELRAAHSALRMGIIGSNPVAAKYIQESRHVNGLVMEGEYDGDEAFFNTVDAVYVVSRPEHHFNDCLTALRHGKHVLCEAPLALSAQEAETLLREAAERGLVIDEGIKTAHSTAYNRMILMAKSGKVGQVVSVDATCTSLRSLDPSTQWGSLHAWGPTALLPVLQLLGAEPTEVHRFTRRSAEGFDEFTRLSFTYPDAVASVKVGKGVKSEGELIISGTKGYIYVPAPWWKTDYFELRYENPADNRRYFYQLDGEGIRNELVGFVRRIAHATAPAIAPSVTSAIASLM